jgi:hypothetical protein
MADAIQNPSQKSGVAFVLRGGQRTGKGFFITVFGALFGQHFLHVSNSKHVTGHFNGHLKDCLILFADEAFWAGDKTHEGVLKTLITEPINLVEFKGKDSLQVPNYARLMMASNKDWVAPMEKDDARFFIQDINPQYKNKRSYFKKILDQLSNENGYSALLHFLQNRDLTGVNITDYPTTKAMIDNKLFSLESSDEWWISKLTDMDSEEALNDQLLDILYEDYQKTTNTKYPSSKIGFSRRLNKLAPHVEIKRTWSQEAQCKIKLYNFGTIARCRRAVEDLLNSEINWEKY